MPRNFSKLKGNDRIWAIESAARTLIEAEEVKADSVLHGEVIKFLKAEQVAREKALKQVQGVE